MLQIVNGIQIPTDDYYISHKEDGLDELHFEVDINDPVYYALNEESCIYESYEHQIYVVKTISGSSRTAKIGCQLDLTDWKGQIEIGYDRSGTAHALIGGFRPSNWTVVDPTPKSDTKSIKIDAPVPLDLALQVQEEFGCRLRFDTVERKVKILYPDDIALSNSYVVDTVNLKSAPEYKGKSNELYTRIYPRGKNNITISSANNGVEYLENFSFTNRIVCKMVSFSDIETAAELKAEAQKRLDTSSQPERSWKLSVVDLYRHNPEKWPDMSLDIFRKIRLSDEYKGFSVNVQIVEDKVYPHYPEKNELTVSTVTKSVQRTLRRLYKDIYDENSRLNMRLNSK